MPEGRGRPLADLNQRLALGDQANRALAAERYDLAIPILEQLRIDDRRANDFASLSRVLEALAWSHRATGATRKAESVVREAIELERATGTPSREAMFSNNLATLLRASGRYFEAFDEYDRALQIRRDLGHELAEAEILANLGTLYASLGFDHAACSNLERASQLHARHARGLGLALTLLDLGTAHSKAGEVEAARRVYGQCIAHLLECRDEMEGSDRRNWELNMGFCLWKRGDLVEAEHHLTQSIALGPDYRAFVHLGNLHRADGAFEKAAHAFRAGLALAQSEDATVEWQIRSDLGQVALKNGRLEEAAAHFSAAVASVEGSRSGLSVTDASRGFLSRAAALYRFAVATEMALGRTEAAFDLSERYRGRVLAEILARGLSSDPDWAHANLLQKELARQLRAVRGALSAAGERDDAHTSALRAMERDLYQRDLELQRELARRLPSDLEGTAPLSLATVQRDLLADGDAILQYVIGEEVGHVFAVTRDALHGFVVPRADDLQVIVEDLRRAVLAEDRDVADAAGLALYDALLDRSSSVANGPALLDLIRTRQRLIIMPDGPLHRLPFALLACPRRVPGAEAHESSIETGPSYLIEHHTLSFALSASTLRRGEVGAERHWSRMFVGFGDPTSPSEKQASRPSSTLSGQARRLPLPGARRELARSAASLEPGLPCSDLEGGTIEAYDGATVSLRLGRHATKAEIEGMFTRDHLRAGRILHLATHALVDDRIPEHSGVFLAASGGDDGLWTSAEIQATPIGAELVVLSGCDTGGGVLADGEGLIGLTRSFLVAGSQAVCSSLWPIVDEDAAGFMMLLYAEIGTGHGSFDAAEALRVAQVRCLQNGIAGAACWAAFQVTQVVV